MKSIEYHAALNDEEVKLLGRFESFINDKENIGRFGDFTHYKWFRRCDIEYYSLCKCKMESGSGCERILSLSLKCAERLSASDGKMEFLAQLNEYDFGFSKKMQLSQNDHYHDLN